MLRFRLLFVGNLRTLENQWHILVATTNLTQQFQACLCIAFLHMREATWHDLHRETGIADDTQHIVVIFLIPVHCLFVIGGKHHLGTSALTLGCGMRVQCLRREVLALGKDIVIEVGKDRGIEADIILHQQNHLHTSLLDVMLYIHLVLYQFDDRQDKVRVTQPAEHIVEDRHILVLNTLRNTMRERSQYDAGDMRRQLFDVTRHSKGIVIGITRHTDDKVDVRRLQHLLRLLCRRHLCKRGRITHTQLTILVKQFLVDTSVILQHKGIIRVRNDEDIEDTTSHQVHKGDILQIKLIPLVGYFFSLTHKILY